MLALRSLRTGPGSMVGRPVAEVVVVHVEEILRSRPGCRLRLRRCRYKKGHTITWKPPHFYFHLKQFNFGGQNDWTPERTAQLHCLTVSLPVLSLFTGLFLWDSLRSVPSPCLSLEQCSSLAHQHGAQLFSAEWPSKDRHRILNKLIWSRAQRHTRTHTLHPVQTWC